MASTKSSLHPRRDSERFMEFLNHAKELLQVKKEQLRTLPDLIKKRKKVVEQQQERINSQTRAEVDGERLKRNRKARMVREAEELKRELPKQIRETEKEIKSLEAQYSKAKAHEAELDANVSQLIIMSAISH